MKQIEKIMLGLAIVIIIIGGIIIKVKGFNVDLKYTESQRLELSLGKEFEIKDIKEITKEILGKDVILQKVEVYEDAVSIISKEITDEQKNEIINKINEKYELELSADEIKVSSVPKTKLYDIAKQYILGFCAITIAVLIYVAIRYNKLGMFKVIIKTAVLLCATELTLAGIIAILRIPFGMFVMPLAFLVYVFSIMYIIVKYEDQLLTFNKNCE